MAIYRQIHMSFWEDSKVVDDFSIEDKYFYLYLLTNPHTNLAGCYELSMKKASEETGFKKDVVEKIISRLEGKHNVIRYDTSTKEVLIVNWRKYNWTDSEKFRKPLYTCIANVKSNDFKEYLLSAYNHDEEGARYRIDTMCIDTNCMDTNCMDTTVTVTDTVTDTVKVKHKYGEYSNVLLTDKELEKLKTEFPSDWESRIENLSVYMQSKGTTYKDHLATIRNWARMEKSKQKKGSRLDVVDTWTLE